MNLKDIDATDLHHITNIIKLYSFDMLSKDIKYLQHIINIIDNDNFYMINKVSHDVEKESCNDVWSADKVLMFSEFTYISINQLITEI